MIFERTREKGANKGKRIKKGKGWDLKVTSRMAIARLLVGMRGYTLARERGRNELASTEIDGWIFRGGLFDSFARLQGEVFGIFEKSKIYRSSR